MKERVKYFHRRFLDKRIAITSLRRLYLQHRIKRKKVRQEKAMPTAAREQFTDNCRKVLQAVEQAQQVGQRIIYLDEINFTKLSLKDREWSCKNNNLAVD